ncbi:tetratricopeptide repeat protein [Clostridium sp. OS1-26]|uniref:tetratricopeptide repeat protein n=1 Tax=Clostridium sp. OS1-26 TaxID=3070681 RepID=UPI0027DFCB0D|nr:tetratricopeptide repeat protein [Clostridium sp. OS1-26]WML33230.1 tetratricopeptide repeat protein [Clostridium sp. OS1-26]
MLSKDKVKRISIIIAIAVIGFIGAGLGAYKYHKAQEYKNLITTANNYMNSGEYDKAIALFNQSLSYKEDISIKSNIKLAENLKEVKSSYDKGISLMNDKKYLEAMEQFKKVTKEDDKLYNNAQKSINECKKQYTTQNVQLANNSIKSGNYGDAYKYIAEVLKIDSNNADAQKLKSDVAKAEQEKKANEEQEKTAAANANNRAVTQEQAIKIISDKITDKGPKTVVQCENIENKNGSEYYYIHVYDNMGSHAATRGWYYVEVSTGKAYKQDLITNRLTPIN